MPFRGFQMVQIPKIGPVAAPMLILMKLNTFRVSPSTVLTTYIK